MWDVTVSPSPALAVLPADLDRREPRIWWQYLAGVAGYLVANIAMGMVAGVLLVLTRGTEVLSDPTAALSEHPFPSMFVGLILYAALAGGFYWVIVRFLAQRPVYELGLRKLVSELSLGFGIGTLLMGLSVGVVALLGGYQVHAVQLSTGILFGLAVGIGPGVAEELLFRGILLRLLDKQLGSWAAIAVTSALFGAVHLSNPKATAFGALAIAVEAGLLLGGAYLLTRRLWLAIGLHIGWNFVQGGIFGINVSGSGYRFDGLLRSSMDGPAWLTGGTMGIEGSVVCVVIGALAGVFLLVLAHRRSHTRPPRQRTAPAVSLEPVRDA